MFVEFSGVSLPDGFQQTRRAGGVAEQVDCFLPPRPLVLGHNYHVGLAALAGNQDGGAAVGRLVEIAGQVLAEIGVRDLVHAYQLLYLAGGQVQQPGCCDLANSRR